MPGSETIGPGISVRWVESVHVDSRQTLIRPA
jgi:hypothetical protein